jgi:hypothetical protein
VQREYKQGERDVSADCGAGGNQDVAFQHQQEWHREGTIVKNNRRVLYPCEKQLDIRASFP